MVWTQDTFTDTNGTLLINHTPNIGTGWALISGTGMKIVGNEVVGQDVATTQHVTTSADIDANHMVESSVKVGISSLATAGITCRHNGTTTYYAAYLDSNVSELRLRKTVNDAHTLLGSYAIPGYSGTTYYLIKLRCTDVSKQVFLDGTQRISSANNDITTGTKAGISVTINGLDYAFDNFLFDDIVIADLLTMDGVLLGDMSADMFKLLTIIDGILSGDDAPGVDTGPYRLQIFAQSSMTRSISVESTLR